MKVRRARRRTGRSRGGEARKEVRTKRRRARLMWVTRAKRDELEHETRATVKMRNAKCGCNNLWQN